MGDYNPELLPLCDLLFNIISLAGYFCDVTFDVLFGYALYERGSTLWFSSTLFFVGFSLLVCQIISLRWYLRSMEARPSGENLQAKSLVALAHILGLGVLWRYFKLFIPVDLRYVKFEVRDLCILRLVHAFCQSAPLLIIQLHLLMNENYGNDLNDLNIVCVSLSLFSVCWALASFSKNVRIHNVHKLVLTWLGVIFQFIWRLGTVGSRAISLVLYASVYGPWLLLVLVLHWAVVFLWLVCPGVVSPSSATALNSGKGGALRITWLAAALACLHLIAYANIDDQSCRLKAVMFYLVMGLENLLLLTSWYLTVQPSYLPLLPIGAVISYIFGLCFMVLYYRFFHVRRLKYEAGGRMETPENETGVAEVENENGSSTNGRPNVSNGAPFATSTPTPLSLSQGYTNGNKILKNQQTRYRYYGGPHRHGGIPGVFNCRFTNPYTAALTKRKKKKPTSFVPPPSIGEVGSSNGIIRNTTTVCPVLPFWCMTQVGQGRGNYDGTLESQNGRALRLSQYPREIHPLPPIRSYQGMRIQNSEQIGAVSPPNGTSLQREKARRGRPRSCFRYYPPPNSSDGDVDSGQEEEEVNVAKVIPLHVQQRRVTRL